MPPTCVANFYSATLDKKKSKAAIEKSFFNMHINITADNDHWSSADDRIEKTSSHYPQFAV